MGWTYQNAWNAFGYFPRLKKQIRLTLLAERIPITQIMWRSCCFVFDIWNKKANNNCISVCIIKLLETWHLAENWWQALLGDKTIGELHILHPHRGQYQHSSHFWQHVSSKGSKNNMFFNKHGPELEVRLEVMHRQTITTVYPGLQGAIISQSP